MTAYNPAPASCSDTAESIRDTLFVIRKAAPKVQRGGVDAESAFDPAQIRMAALALQVLPAFDEPDYKPAGREVVLVENLHGYLVRAEEEIMGMERVQEAILSASQSLSMVGQVRDHYGADTMGQTKAFSGARPKEYSLSTVMSAIRKNGSAVRRLLMAMPTQG